MIYLIGVDHALQHDGVCIHAPLTPGACEGCKRERNHLADYLKGQIDYYEIKFIGEEFVENQFEVKGNGASIVKHVADIMGLKYICFEEDEFEREKWGYLKTNSTNINNDIRETGWLNKIDNSLQKVQNSVLILGSSHLSSFICKLNRKSLDAKILVNHWDWNGRK